jgi:hypothetical protein
VNFVPTPSKRETEMTYGRVLLGLLGINSILEPGLEPAPDLLFSYLGKNIGLEHTRLFAEDGRSSTSFQSYERNIDVIAEMCQIQYSKRGLPPVEVKLHMPQARPSKARIPVLVNWIVDAVAQALPQNPGRVELCNDWGGYMPIEINTIRIIRFEGQAGTSFFSPRAGFIRSIDTEWLQAKIDAKSKRYPGYLAGRDEVWLLMVEEQKGLASTMEIPDIMYSDPINPCGFARVFLLRGRSDLHELRCTH